MKKQETLDAILEKLFQYTQKDFESDLKFIEVLEAKQINKPLLDFLKWKTSQYNAINVG